MHQRAACQPNVLCHRHWRWRHGRLLWPLHRRHCGDRRRRRCGCRSRCRCGAAGQAPPRESCKRRPQRHVEPFQVGGSKGACGRRCGPAEPGGDTDHACTARDMHVGPYHMHMACRAVSICHKITLWTCVTFGRAASRKRRRHLANRRRRTACTAHCRVSRVW